jgi:hypothetical protein
VIVFGPERHGFRTIDTGFYFLGICVGTTLGVGTNALFQKPSYRRDVAKSGGMNTREGRVRMG